MGRTFLQTGLVCLIVGMIAPVPVRGCSSFFVSAGGELMFGNTLDWHTDDGFLVVNKRNVTKRGLSWFAGAPVWTSRYGSLTVNQWGREFPARGMNEAGLVFGEMTLSATQFPDPDARAPMQINQWLQYMLDTCATVEEVLLADRQVRINPDQYHSHFLFADRSGHALTVEWLNGRLVYHTSATLPIAALTNDTYDNVLAAYRANPVPVAGSASAARFSRLADMMARYNRATDGSLPGYVFRMLDQVQQPGWTKWKLAFDVGRGRLMFQTLQNSEFRYVELGKLDFSASSPVETLDINAMLAGDLSGAFTEFSYAANRDLLITVARKGGYGTNPSWLADYYNLPGTTVAATNEFWVRGLTDVVPGGGTTLTAAPAFATGAVCQWQIDTGTDWRDLGDRIATADGTTTFTGTATGVLGLANATRPLQGARFRCVATSGGRSTVSAVLQLTVALPPSVSAVPVVWVPPMPAGGNTVLTTWTPFVNGNPGLIYQWQRNGRDLGGATGPTLPLYNVQPSDTGLYAATVSGTTTQRGDPAMVGIAATEKLIGSGEEIGCDIAIPNGNICDQVLLRGVAAAITADRGQITRVCFVDLTNDIVQVEFSGAGTLALVLDDASGPATAANYDQPAVAYMKGHAGIVITGADATTNVAVFSVGRSTAVNQSLFRREVDYDGVADLAFLAIASAAGRFGGVRTANVHYFASRGFTGILAPGVVFEGPVFVGDVTAFDAATPVIQVGAVNDARITGGGLAQANGAAVQVSGLTQLKFTDGGDSHGKLLPAQSNQAVLKESGVDVTAQIVAGP